MEAERKVREEEERKRQEAQRRREEEVRQQEEIARQQKEAQEKQRQDQEQQKAAKDAQKRKGAGAAGAAMDERTKTEAEQRKTLGATTALDDWRIGRENLMRLKTENTRVVKADAQMKSAWGGLRRQVVRKFGQVTNDAESIARVSNEITQLAMPPGGLHPLILNSFYSSIAKAIMQQAETEVTAEKASAIPIARVAHRLLGTLDGFADIFFAKLVQRVGAWPVPTAPPPADYDGQQWKSDHERFGYRPSQSSDGMESPPQHVERVTGVMRVYFHILATPPGDKPISNRFFQPTRYWVWYARALSHPSMLASDVCASLIHAGLEIFGSDARKIWGKQWTKVLALIYDLVKNGLGDGKVFGGTSPEGVASRMRVQLEIDSIMGAGN
ncbi:GLE1-like protein-domain-containing protein [Schizophyllum amplum]|uniref:mRNA export factor GLE1 n=1 Tax=Schizophyllum amplum TaxID=97359 RepID=A0A550C2H1_9AGAR|nr:GLE1-like protein-domain-containing protein [Auriculariopsis ampla]